MKHIKYQVILPDPNKIYSYPGEACGEDPPPGWVRPSPVKPSKAQLARRSGTEEIDAVVQTGVELLSGCFWFGVLFFLKFLELLPENLERAHAKKK